MAQRILFATMPFDGHFSPLTGIARHLKDQGHDVRWYAGPSYAKKLADLGVPHVPFKRAREVSGENIADLFPARAALKGPKLLSFDLEQVFVANVEHHYHDILEVHETFAFDAFVCDPGFFAAHLIAANLSPRIYTIGVGPLFVLSDDPPPFFGLKPARTIVDKLVHRVVRALLNSTMKQGVKTYNAVLASEGMPPVTVGDFFELMRKCATYYFQSGVPGFDYPRRSLPANVKFVGPLLPNRKATVLPVELEDKLRQYRSVIVVSQGTLDNTDAEKLFVPALEALKGASHLVIATTGGKNTEELRKRFPETNVVIEDFVDFDLLFEHADLFICNGGYGSILLALSHGVPILSAGTREGKNDINARIDYCGFGVDLQTERPTPEKIAKGVTRVLGDKRFAKNVERIRAEFRSYNPLDLIDGYVAAGDAASLSELPLDNVGDDNRATSGTGSAGATLATKRRPAN
jgi:UDP:flavonoid glycosyltransferase YjiC (YdhE family)